MPLSTDQWHARYARQAGWTTQLRRYLFERGNIQSAKRVLDCGSGTGALETTPGGLHSGFAGTSFGLDINPNSLAYAKSIDTKTPWLQGDCLRLPFKTGGFDIAFCHFLLLWVADPLKALQEMRRVTRAGGFVIALAEPDYGGRIDYPPELEVLASWQKTSLRRQGANPTIGRRLGWLFRQAGLEDVQTGVLGAQWQGAPACDEIESEWEVLFSDMQTLLGVEDEARWLADYEKLKRLEESAWQNGERVLYVPTFYAIGIKPVKPGSKPDSNVVKF